MPSELIPLPIDSVLPEIAQKLGQHSALIVEAPPGSGKTTRVAPFLIEHGLAENGRRIYLLQPRRVAARATATRIANERGWRLGQTVGYQVRFESVVAHNTPLIVATEGILLRRLQEDPILPEVSVVVLDEFHERTLQSDLLLGMLRRLQATVRDDLRIVVMSATLSVPHLQAFLGNAPLVQTSGRMFPVDIKYRPLKPYQKLTDHVVESVRTVAQQKCGDILVFLPGVGEIRRVQQDLVSASELRDWRVLELHGSLPLEQQTQALFPGEQPRVVLATNVAETSLTLEGIRTVVDSGVARVLRFDSAVGLDRLELEPICQASATQRAGRAGRTAEGTCIRLWEATSQRSRPEFLEPEIRRVDISSAILQLYEWGERPDEDFPWLEPPPANSLAAAIELLVQLGAVTNNSLTAIGRTMARIPVPPRMARMLIYAHQIGQLDEVTLAAAMLSERDPFLRHATAKKESNRFSKFNQTTTTSRWNCDVAERVAAIRRFAETGGTTTPFGEINRNAAGNIVEVAQQIADQTIRELGPVGAPEMTSIEAVGRSLLAAYPDRLAKRRGPNDLRGLMVGGRGVRIGPNSGVTQPELFLCIDVDDGGNEATVRQASGIERDWLPSDLIRQSDELFFHPTQKQVVARRREYWLDLILNESSIQITDDKPCASLLFEHASKVLREVMPKDSEKVDSFITRAACLQSWAPDLNLPVVDDSMLRLVLRELCEGRRSFDELRQSPWLDWIRSRYSNEHLIAIDREAPERIEVPSGSRIPLEYSPGKPPVLAVRIQEIFSWRATPRIAFGRIPVLLHLLAPNFRPQQITDDLASFWATTYSVVRKELKRRYPKHAWPEDPLTATPVRKG